ncbi:MAG TPA: G1 family glutamic endopeptidase, partial [Acidimicrobiales bacterium]|nr:G1 family glutamic endopeptidase [Acidimicrobiales bacterium]
MSRRRTTRTVVSAGLVGGLGLLWVGAAPPSRAAVPAVAATGGTLVPAHHRALPLHGGTVDSVNWAGYAVTPGSGVTAVKSTFTVPGVGALPPGFSATWAGIGGYSTSDLILAGVGEQSTPSDPLFGPQYYAWYEILPAAETPISGCSGDPNCTVRPGDQITVDIHNVSGNTWSVNLTDANHWTYSTNVPYASSESSAEWIQEAPTLAVLQTIQAPVGTVHFGPTSTFTHAGTTSTIAGGQPTLINEGVGVVNEATTS